MPTISEMDISNYSNWRSGLSVESRQKIVKRIMDTLQRSMPPVGQECMGELSKISWRFEEKIFLSATDQQDYLQKIAFKLLSWDRRAQATPVIDVQARVQNLT